MIDAAAGLHGIFLQQAQARRRLARVLDDGASALDRAHDGGRGRRDAGKMPEQVQHHALAGQERARGTGEQGHRAAGLDVRAVWQDDRGARRLRQPGDHEPHGVDAGDAARLAAADDGRHRRAGRDDGKRGDVAEIPEILGECARHDPGQRLVRGLEAQATWLRVTASDSTGAGLGVTKLRDANSARGAGWSLR